jgi:hypothetical protein
MFYAKTEYGSNDFVEAARQYAEEQERKTPRTDVLVQGEGSIFMFRLLTSSATDWIEENVNAPVFFGDALIVEHRFALEICMAMQAAGLRLHAQDDSRSSSIR